MINYSMRVSTDGGDLPRVVMTATDLARNGSEVRQRATEEPILITRRGEPIAVLDARPATLGGADVSLLPSFSARDLNRAGGVGAVLDLVAQGKRCRLTDTNQSAAVLEPAESIQDRIRSKLSAVGAEIAAPQGVDSREHSEMYTLIARASDGSEIVLGSRVSHADYRTAARRIALLVGEGREAPNREVEIFAE